MPKSAIKNAQQEVKTLRKLNNHRNIVGYQNVDKDKDFIYITLDLHDFTLDAWMKEEDVENMSNEAWSRKASGLVKDLLTGLEHLHFNNMLHRDLKPSNLFVVPCESTSEKGKSHLLKLADFGLCRSLTQDTSTHRTSPFGTKDWQAKEVLDQIDERKPEIDYKKPCDIQVGGMVCFYIMSRGIHPYAPDGKCSKINGNVVDGKYDLRAVNDSVACDLVKHMLAETPSDRPSAGELLRFKSEFEKLQCLGTGRVGTVFKACDKFDDQDYAIKRIHLNKRDAEKQKAEREVKALIELSGHPGIVRYHHSWIESPPQVWLKQFDRLIPSRTKSQTTSDKKESFDEQEGRSFEWLEPGHLLYVKMELCQETLKAWLSSNTGRDQKQVQEIIRQTVDAVHHVHEHGLMHGDIKPSNLFVQEKDEKVTVKLGDFGLVTSTTSDHQTTIDGTELYMSPKQNAGHSYTNKVDIYALGIVFLELLCAFPTEQERVDTLNKLKGLGFCDEFADELSCDAQLALNKDPVANNLLKGMLEKEPSQRMSTKDILSHPYLWDGTRRYTFLAVIGGLDEIEYSHVYEKEPRPKSIKAALVHSIEDTKPRVLPPPPDGATTADKPPYWDGDWESLSIVDMLRKAHPKKKGKHSTEKPGHTQSLCKLLWLIRNSKFHDDQSEAFKAELGDCPFDYFNCNFPQLLMEVYNVIKSCDDWTQKPNLKEFFAAPAKTEETGAVAATAPAVATPAATTAATATAATTAAATTAAATAAATTTATTTSAATAATTTTAATAVLPDPAAT
ncbi:Eukaryotic translation initiation factor 2-alpha kinase [Lamellibrachia satsuma]|nr:Eukaryotic translation initiation factor 2-alpha kinase [Lamellibrachia satsuma]